MDSDIIFENDYVRVYRDRKVVFKFSKEEEVKKHQYMIRLPNGNNIWADNVYDKKENGKIDILFDIPNMSAYYLGSMMNDKLNGEGIFYFSPENFYTGEFKDDNYEGDCCFVYEKYIIIGKIDECKMGKASYATYKNATILRGNEIYTAEKVKIDGDNIELSGTMTHGFQKKDTIKI